MRTNQMARWLSAMLVCVLVLACAVPAQADNTGSHSVVQRSYPFYIGAEADDMLNKEFPLCFIDGVDDLPFVELSDWAALLYFINTELNEDSGYDLSIEYEGDTITLERENGYTLDFDFAGRRLIF